MLRQRTLQSDIRATGVGLHSGEKVSLHLKPAPVNTGVVFRRMDLSPVVDVPAAAALVAAVASVAAVDRVAAKVVVVAKAVAAANAVDVQLLNSRLLKHSQLSKLG